MSHMSGILISRYMQLLYAIPFVTYCFQLGKIVGISGIVSLILMQSLVTQSVSLRKKRLSKQIPITMGNYLLERQLVRPLERQ